MWCRGVETAIIEDNKKENKESYLDFSKEKWQGNREDSKSWRKYHKLEATGIVIPTIMDI